MMIQHDDTTLWLDRDDISPAQSTRTCAHWLKIAKKSVSNSVWWNLAGQTLYRQGIGVQIFLGLVFFPKEIFRKIAFDDPFISTGVWLGSLLVREVPVGAGGFAAALMGELCSQWFLC